MSNNFLACFWPVCQVPKCLFLYKFEVIYKLLRFWLKLMLQWLLSQLESKLRIWVPESWFFFLPRHRTPPPSANTFDANPSNEAKKPQEMPKVPRKVFDGINMTQGRWDQSRNFKIFDHVFTGSNYDKLSREFNVTLATQSSLDKIYWLGQVRKIHIPYVRNYKPQLVYICYPIFHCGL